MGCDICKPRKPRYDPYGMPLDYESDQEHLLPGGAGGAGGDGNQNKHYSYWD